jgi:hypothetical protein
VAQLLESFATKASALWRIYVQTDRSPCSRQIIARLVRFQYTLLEKSNAAFEHRAALLFENYVWFLMALILGC